MDQPFGDCSWFHGRPWDRERKMSWSSETMSAEKSPPDTAKQKWEEMGSGLANRLASFNHSFWIYCDMLWGMSGLSLVTSCFKWYLWLNSQQWYIQYPVRSHHSNPWHWQALVFDLVHTFKRFLFRFIYLHECFACMFVSVPHECHGHWSQKRVPDLLELELQRLVSPMWVLEPEPRTSAGAASALNCWISLQLPCKYFDNWSLSEPSFTFF